MSIGVVVPAGGDARRYGGGDKLAAELDGGTLLDRTLGALPTGAHVVVVGPETHTTRPVIWTREEPPGAGPLAAVAAGVIALPPDVVLVALVGGDMPTAGRALPSLQYALAATAAAGRTSGDGRAVECAVALDASGTPQPLLALWRRAALARRLAVLDDPAGRPVRALLDGAASVAVTVPHSATTDVDTRDDLEALRRWLGGPTRGRPEG